MKSDPDIQVSNIRLTAHCCRTGGTAAWADLHITGKGGGVREWQNVRLVFDGFFPISLPIGSYSLLVEGQFSPRTCRRGTRLIPPVWQRAARWAVYDAACEAEEAQKKRQAEEIAAGTRWAPLPLSAIHGPGRQEASR